MLEQPKSRGSQIPNYSFYVLASDVVDVMNLIMSLRNNESHELYHFVEG